MVRLESVRPSKRRGSEYIGLTAFDGNGSKSRHNIAEPNRSIIYIYLIFQPPMPPKLRGSLQKSLLCLDGSGIFLCPSCATWRRSFSTRAKGVPRRGARLPSPAYRQLATSSVINAGRDVPPRFKELHEALTQVGNTAPSQINLSRLQLALRGLESEEPLVRVAGA